jgi:hypothetical protein
MPEGMYKYKDILDTVTKDILEQYLKGEKALNELIEEEVGDFRDALLQSVNGFDKKSEVEKSADMPSGEMAYCPVDPVNIKVRLFRNICQDWQEVPKCFHGLCGFFPVFDKAPVTNVKLEPKDKKEKGNKEVKGSVEEDVREMLEDLEKKGVRSMAEKFRFIRNSFLEKIGVNELRNIIRKNMKRGSEMEKVLKKADYRNIDDWKVDLYDMVKSNGGGVVKGNNGMKEVKGTVKEVQEFVDGSYLLVVSDGNSNQMDVVLPEQVMELSMG